MIPQMLGMAKYSPVVAVGLLAASLTSYLFAQSSFILRERII